jgi:hypothetical protein
VDDHAEQPTRQVARVMPAFQFELLRLIGMLTVRRGGIGIAAIKLNVEFIQSFEILELSDAA